jgi:hypothetical protein
MCVNDERVLVQHNNTCYKSYALQDEVKAYTEHEVCCLLLIISSGLKAAPYAAIICLHLYAPMPCR